MFDTESFRNYWAIAFQDVANPATCRVFEIRPDRYLDRDGVSKILRQWRIVGFNSRHYDVPMTAVAMHAENVQAETLKAANDWIIVDDMKSWDMLAKFGLDLDERRLDHIDLIEVAGRMVSLKLYAGRIHSRRMQNLPYSPDEVLTEAQMDDVRDYLLNDLSNTADLYRALGEHLELRTKMSERYGIDLRSKSDAQIAEAVLKSEIEKRTGEAVYRPKTVPIAFHYDPPEWIKFWTPVMQQRFEVVKGLRFRLDAKGSPAEPEELKEPVLIGGRSYAMGIGGLHSKEKAQACVSNDEFVFIDRDVTSYYPASILNCGFYPPHLGKVFLDVYRGILTDRVEAKRAGRKVEADSLKIVLNGSFGKLGSPYSVLYAPKLLIQTTLTGQLALLMLIEAIDVGGFDVVSANTDGVVTRVARDRRDDFERIIRSWELLTGYGTEETEYAALYSRDVNNYIAQTVDGKLKLKGAFGGSSLKTHPKTDICTEAVIRRLIDGTPIEDTVRGCTDIRKFVEIRRVAGGAEFDDVNHGKAIRYYYSWLGGHGFRDGKSGNIVAGTKGAALLMELPDELPDDIDYSYYIREAYAILEDVGLTVIDPALRGRTGIRLARLASARGTHWIDLSTGAAICGKVRSSIRDPWIEYVEQPAGMRLCPRCRRSIV